MGELIQRAGAVVLPWWAKYLAIAVLLLAVYAKGRLDEAHSDADKLAAYIAAQAGKTVLIVKRQVQTVTKVETQYRDRIRLVYAGGKDLEAHVPDYISPASDKLFAVPVGFVRVLDAAWSGEPVGPSADSDREPAGVSLSTVAENEVANATSCRAWREQALGWRVFYAGQQVAINGKAGAWAAAALPAVPPE